MLQVFELEHILFDNAIPRYRKTFQPHTLSFVLEKIEELEMAKRKRPWDQWPKRIGDELKGVSPLLTLGGVVGGSAAGLTTSTAASVLGVSFAAVIAPFAAPIAVAGGLFGVAVCGYAIAKSVPPKMSRLEDFNGQIVSIEQLGNLFPAPIKLSFIGSTQAGKTTLKNRLAFDPSTAERTRGYYGYITTLPTSPPTYVAVLDGAGDAFGYQFELAALSDFLCILIDHNISHTASEIDNSRLDDHAYFLRQIMDYFDQKRIGKKSLIKVLVNKRDLWQVADQAEVDSFTKFYEAESSKWRSTARADIVEVNPHSNEIPNDIGLFVQCIKENAVKYAQIQRTG